ncbi:S1 RNA-binding domain-containing protein [uncultured Clostridium sp.]|uniref:CvfB family protein n=1 Tax=uncultured Clostridium sp. TaxID=59620 RepID=UPI00267363EF|nr:S1-like domain-containing RNA-binding protein [uncultured Clostridium sp.]
MLRIGEYNKMKVDREKDFGFYLRELDGRAEVLLPKSLLEGNKVSVGDEVEVFIYRDSKDRALATFKKPLAKAFDVAYLEVVQQSEFGAFIDFGLDRDIFVPLKEQRYKLHTGKKYLFYIYVDKTDRLAATTEVENYIEIGEGYKVGDEVTAMVYSKTPAGTLNVAIDGKYKGLVLPNEYYFEVHPGQEMKLRVKRVYEDGVIGLTPRKTRLNERDALQEKIVKYMEKNGGFMTFNDKSSPEDIKITFGTSKNYFKMALGGLMKKGLITQDAEGCRLL